MKKRSIRFKMTLLYTLTLLLLAAIIFSVLIFAIRLTLRGTVRQYLIGMVEENVDKIVWSDLGTEDSGELSIRYGGGTLVVDLDFVDSVHNVRAGLYAGDGRMLYGENPVSRESSSEPFTVTRLWHTSLGGVRYEFYDRRLDIPAPDGETLWIRGVVAETDIDEKVSEMTRIALLFLPALLIAAALSGWFLTSRLLSPIRKIEWTAERISEGTDLERRIDTGGNRDEIGRLGEVFNKMLARLEHAFETERQLTSDVSHELRTPLAVVLAECEYTLERPREREDYVEALEVIAAQSGRMKSLIGDMLDYARMERADTVPDGEVDLSALTAETAASMALIAPEGTRFETQIEPALTVRGSADLIARLEQNLISNACRYGKPGGTVSVELRKEDSGDPGEASPLAALRVRDDGQGIKEEDFERIFERFWRCDESRSTEGTGLGLAMVKKIAELHGAEIRVESKPGEGSVFTVLFPLPLSDAKK